MEPDEIHDMVMFLNEEVAAGRTRINSRHLIDALARIKFGADGKADPSTVDGSVRAFGLAMLGSKMRPDLGEPSLHDVQSMYFDILNRNYGALFEDARCKGASPQQIGEFLSNRPRAVEEFASQIEEFASGIEAFWRLYGPTVSAHLNNSNSLKSVFGGDVFPSYTSNVAGSVGLYMDTIVLPDPLASVLTLRDALPVKEVFRLVLKHALNALGYRELALAEVDPPIVVIAPDRFGLDVSYSRAVQIAGETDALIHAGHIFDRSFGSVEELLDFVDRLGDPTQVVAKMADPGRLIFDGEWTEPLPDQLVRYAAMHGVGAEKGFGNAVYRSISGRMMMSNNSLLGSSLVGGSPYIDAPASWKYFQWKNEYDAMAGRESDSMSHTLVSKGLESGLLSGLPPELLIELRKNGAAAEVRSMIGKGIGEIHSASDADVSKVADHVIANIDSAFEDHDKSLREIASSERKFYGLDVSRFVINGGLGVTAALTESRVLGAITALAALTGTPSVNELKKRYGELRLASANLRRSPVGMMFHHLGDRFGFSGTPK